MLGSLLSMGGEVKNDLAKDEGDVESGKKDAETILNQLKAGIAELLASLKEKAEKAVK